MPAVVDPDLREVGSKQSPLHVAVGSGIELARVLQQVKILQYKVTFLPYVVLSGFKPLHQGCPLDLELAQSFPHFACRQRSVGREIEKTFLFHIEACQLLLHSRMGLALGTESLLEAGPHLLAHRGNLIRSQLESVHFTLECFLDQRHRQVGEITRPVLPTRAQKVLVHRTVRVGHLGVDELAAVLIGATTSTSEDGPQEVGVDDIPLIAPHAHVEDALHTLEKLRGDERLVSAGIDLPLVGHHAQVIWVTEDMGKLAPRHHLLLPFGGAPGREPLFGEFLLQTYEAVLAGGVLREGPRDEWSPRLVDGDGVDEATFEFGTDVLVAESGPSNGAAVLGFVEHLVADVLAALADLHLVHDVGDGLHRVGHVALAELLLGGDELDVHAGQNPLGDGGIGLVSEDARAHVDDDVANFRVLLDIVEQLAEDRPLGDGLRRVARLDELVDNRGFEAFGPLARRLALGGNRVAIRVNIDRRVELALGGHPQVEHRGSPWRALAGRSLGIVKPQQALEARERATTVSCLGRW